MLIDTHAHLNFNAYKEDTDEVIHRSLDNNVWIINVGSQYETSKRAIAIAERYERGVYAAIGLHPIHLSSGIFKTKIDKEEIEFETREEDFDFSKYRELAKSPKVVAIGEIGFDYYYKPKTKIKLQQFKEKQKEVFLQQLELARELNLPVIFHCRMAHDDLINELTHCSHTGIKKNDELEIKGVIHCFTGTQEQAEKYLEMGFYLGFDGLIFKMDSEKIIKKTPLERILVETDCPYLTPPQEVGRNEPVYVKYIAEKISKIKNLTFKEVTKVTTQNAKKLFKI